jgi:hypothetical protein
MHDEASAFFVAFSVFYIRVSSKKQALPTQDLPTIKCNPYGVNLASELTELAYKKVQPALRVGGKGTHTKAGLANARPAYYEVQPATRVTNRLTKSPHHQITNKLQFLD